VFLTPVFFFAVQWATERLFGPPKPPDTMAADTPPDFRDEDVKPRRGDSQ
jgi:hypothetical protein